MSCVRSSFCFMVVLLGCAPDAVASEKAPAFSFRTYDVPGQLQTSLTGINNEGTMVGWTSDKEGKNHPFAVVHGKYQQLDLPHANQMEIWGTNSDGDLVGSYAAPRLCEDCSQGFIYRDGKLKKIIPPGAAESAAFGMNDHSVVVGFVGDGFGGEVGFIHKHGKYRTLEVPGANGQRAVGVNSAGLVTIDWTTSAAFNVSLYDGKTYTDISVPGAVDTQGGAINNLGDIVLDFDAGVGKQIHGALLHKGRYYQFDVPQAKYDTLPLGINDKHTIVGSWSNSQLRARSHGFIATY